MILVIGAEGSGKKDYVKGLGYSEMQFGNAADDALPVLDGLHKLVFSDPKTYKEQMTKMEATGETDFLIPYLRKEVVICNEVGSGIIPMDANDRMAREQTGRLCIQLAKRAEKVVRMVCGIPNIIK